MTWRKLRVWMDRLPPESHTKAEIRDSLTPEQFAALPEPDGAWGQWSKTELLLAAVADRVARLEWLTALVNSPKGKAPKMPEPIPRPGVSGGLMAGPGRDVLRTIAELKARQYAMGADPTEEQIRAVLDEMMGGDGDE